MGIIAQATYGVFRLTAFNSMYVDYGLIIERFDGEDWLDLFHNPHCLSVESYGRKPHPLYEDWDDAEEAELNGDSGAFVPWDEADWIECLRNEADDFIEAFVGDVEDDKEVK